MEENESNFTYISALLVTHIGHANVIYPIDYTMFILCSCVARKFHQSKTSAFLTFTSSNQKMTNYIKHEMQQHRYINNDNNISRNPLSLGFSYADTYKITPL